ncbi:Type III restriction enzyme, res subunit [uncultured archaeon]|nr:Type III restriction enzyme, res subunit [uncultured archaeon]
MSSLYKGPELRGWQSEAIEAWEKHRVGIIQAVPCAGKTVLAVKLITKKLEENPDLKVLIVCPRLTLIQQWIDSIHEFSNIQRKEIYEVSSNNESKAYVCAQDKIQNYKVFISTFHQIKQFFNECKWKDHEWFLIVDEMHNTTENYKFPNEPITYKLGLSATPKKKGKGADFNLGGIVYTYTFSQALADKIILDPVIKIVFYSVNKQLFKKIDSADQTVDLVESAYDDFLPDEGMDNIEKILSMPAKKKVKKDELEGAEELKPEEEPDVFSSKSTDFVGITRILEDNFNIGKKNSLQTLVFVNRIKKADLLNKMLAERFSDKVSHSYHSKSEKYNTKNHFNDLKSQFAEGKFNVLISVGTLGEGIDFPYASHGIIASPIYNPTSFVQKVGRLLRSYKDHRKAVIYYYVPSELISRLLTDEKIEPNYFKSVIKIADKNGDLYFVDRKSLHEEKGSLSDLLLQGSAYERNEDIKRIKVPYDLDSIMRFFKRIYPETAKDLKRFFPKMEEEKDKNEAEKVGDEVKGKNKNAKGSKGKTDTKLQTTKTNLKVKKELHEALNEPDEMDITSEPGAEPAKQIEYDFSPLRTELSKHHAIMLASAKNLEANLKGILLIQKKFAGRKFKDFDNVTFFVKEALRQKIITKIKYGQELEKMASDDKSVLSPSEQEMLRNMVSAELGDFCSKQKDLEKVLTSLSSSINLLEKNAKLKKHEGTVMDERIAAMNRIAKIYFDLQSLFLDELELSDLAKGVSSNEKKFFLTIGKDIFLTKQVARKFSYPEDFGLSRWREEKEVVAPIIVLTPTEKFCKRIMHLMGTKEGDVCAITDWNALKKTVCEELKICLQTDEDVLKELERHKFEKEFSFEKLFFVTEAIKRKKK